MKVTHEMNQESDGRGLNEAPIGHNIGAGLILNTKSDLLVCRQR